DLIVTGVQTCALPILKLKIQCRRVEQEFIARRRPVGVKNLPDHAVAGIRRDDSAAVGPRSHESAARERSEGRGFLVTEEILGIRSEERRVGKTLGLEG